jgi:hypothetical protein
VAGAFESAQQGDPEQRQAFGEGGGAGRSVLHRQLPGFDRTPDIGQVATPRAEAASA